jgi:antitoxin (DNA-binding transcriptional repressor) of toxin-antitoxin stability system
MTNTISKSILNANMLEIFRQLEISGKELIITDGGKPVLKIVPIKSKQTAEELFGDVQGRVRYH